MSCLLQGSSELLFTSIRIGSAAQYWDSEIGSAVFFTQNPPPPSHGPNRSLRTRVVAGSPLPTGRSKENLVTNRLFNSLIVITSDRSCSQHFSAFGWLTLAPLSRRFLELFSQWLRRARQLIWGRALKHLLKSGQKRALSPRAADVVADEELLEAFHVSRRRADYKMSYVGVTGSAIRNVC